MPSLLDFENKEVRVVFMPSDYAMPAFAISGTLELHENGWIVWIHDTQDWVAFRESMVESVSEPGYIRLQPE